MMQNFKKKISSATGKALTLSKVGIDPFLEGKFNFENTNIDIELLAIDRTKECLMCDDFVDEPIDFLKVEDKNIPEISNKMCDECGCTLSYKLRQSKTKCKQWVE